MLFKPIISISLGLLSSESKYPSPKCWSRTEMELNDQWLATLESSHQYILSQDKHDKVIYVPSIGKKWNDHDIHDNYFPTWLYIDWSVSLNSWFLFCCFVSVFVLLKGLCHSSCIIYCSFPWIFCLKLILITVEVRNLTWAEWLYSSVVC